MTTVVNKYKVSMSDADIVYIGRGSKWGNPYTSLSTPTKAEMQVATREESIERYKQYLWNQIRKGVITKEMLLELDGKRLACYYAPKSCHGDVLVAAIEWAKGETK
jgi:hypothetical protein